MRPIPLLLILLWIPSSVLANHRQPPTPTSRYLEYESAERLFIKSTLWNNLAEIKTRWEKDPDEALELRYRALTLGTYYRVHTNVKLGVFYRVQQGARHDDDWVSESGATGGPWNWRDTAKRAEHVLITDVTPRVMVPWLPGKNWVFGLKARHLYNTFNDHHTLKLRPGLTYFWVRGLDPFLTINLKSEFYFPVNYGSASLYETWFYAGVIYHLSRRFEIGLYGALKTVTWGTSSAWESLQPSRYTSDFNSVVLGTMFHWRIGIPGSKNSRVRPYRPSQER